MRKRSRSVRDPGVLDPGPAVSALAEAEKDAVIDEESNAGITEA